MNSPSLTRLAPPVFALLLTAACAHYEPKPFAPEQTLRELQSRRLTDPELQARVKVDAASPNTWGRAQWLLAALELSPALAEARAQFAQSAAALNSARAYENPTISLSSEYDTSRADESPWLWGIGTSFLLDTFLSRPQRIDLAQAGIRGAHADLSEALWTVRRDVRVALLSIVIARKRVNALEQEVQQRSELAKLARSRVRAGESARPEESQAQLELLRSQLALDDAKRAVSDAQGALAAVLGVSTQAVSEIAPRWEDLDTLQPPAQFTLGTLRDQALLSRPDLERAIADYQAADLELRRQVHQQYWQASVGPGYTYDHGIRKVTLGASFSLPIFNRNQGPIAEANAARDTAGLHAMTVQATILSEIESATTGYANAVATLDRVRAQRVAAEEGAASARRAFAADATDRPTLLAAELAVTTENAAEIDALERAQQALGQLEDALRTPLVGPETQVRSLP
jgi:cobalt-zinc-cadmium efflux system outer membrane protein